MYGTIGRFKVQPGHEHEFRALQDEWIETIRPSVPGEVLALIGQSTERPGEMITVVLMQDEATYRGLADRPEQDAWYRRVVEHLIEEPTWDDIAWDNATAPEAIRSKMMS